ncbi:hypothetical protein Fmac_018013 [Flemingia macrophylla]|uniref:Uncharacterized protein n=1 Tax=Flemingia macrophylla TaxID=520843 RepID=A0ABD1M3R3_9FABA
MAAMSCSNGKKLGFFTIRDRMKVLWKLFEDFKLMDVAMATLYPMFLEDTIDKIMMPSYGLTVRGSRRISIRRYLTHKKQKLHIKYHSLLLYVDHQTFLSCSVWLLHASSDLHSKCGLSSSDTVFIYLGLI